MKQMRKVPTDSKQVIKAGATWINKEANCEVLQIPWRIKLIILDIH